MNIFEISITSHSRVQEILKNKGNAKFWSATHYIPRAVHCIANQLIRAVYQIHEILYNSTTQLLNLFKCSNCPTTKFSKYTRHPTKIIELRDVKLKLLNYSTSNSNYRITRNPIQIIESHGIQFKLFDYSKSISNYRITGHPT